MSDKKPKEGVHYRRGSKASGYCRGCRYFEKEGPNRCTKVQGRIDHGMTCDLWEGKL